MSIGISNVLKMCRVELFVSLHLGSSHVTIREWWSGLAIKTNCTFRRLSFPIINYWLKGKWQMRKVEADDDVFTVPRDKVSLQPSLPSPHDPSLFSPHSPQLIHSGGY